MSFGAFEQMIRSAALRAVAAHWNSARGARLMPAWQDIRPAEIAQHLSIIWAYRYDRGDDSFVGRIAGESIERVFGKSFRGTPLGELYPADQLAKRHASFKRIACQPALCVEEGMIFRQVRRYGFGERIVLPTATDGETGDGIFGATVYETFRESDTAQLPDTEYWFTL